MNSNGIITTSGPYTLFDITSFPLSNNNPSISAYWADIDPENIYNLAEAAVYYRQSTDATLLQRATDEVLETFADQVPEFQATWIMIVTWHRLVFFGYEPFAVYAEFFAADEDDAPVSMPYANRSLSVRC